MLKVIAHALKTEMSGKLYVLSWMFFSILTFTLLSTYLRIDRFYFDPGEYFDASTYFFRGFTNFNIPFRGYSFPLILAPCHVAAKYLLVSKLLAYKLFASVGHSFFIVIVLPVLIGNIFQRPVKLYMVAAFYAAIMFFWYGLIVYPLTDLPALYFLSASILLVRKWKGWQAVLAAGIILGLASNFRPIYLCVLPLFVIYTLVLNGGARRKATALAALILGIFVAWSPQILINKVNFDTYSPLVQTHITFGDGLYFTQVNLGFAVEKYEGGNIRNQLSSEVFYFNERAVAIIEKENQPAKKPFADFGSLLGLFAKYPLDFTAIYSKHIFNALDAKYPDAITFDFDRSRVLYSFLNYTVIFFALFLFVTNYKTVLYDRENILILSILLLPVAFTVFTRIEPRFFLPLQVVFYAACCFCDYRRQFLSKSNVYYASLIFSYAAFVGLCFYISSRTVGTEISSNSIY